MGAIIAIFSNNVNIESMIFMVFFVIDGKKQVKSSFLRRSPDHCHSRAAGNSVLCWYRSQSGLDPSLRGDDNFVEHPQINE